VKFFEWLEKIFTGELENRPSVSVPSDDRGSAPEPREGTRPLDPVHQEVAPAQMLVDTSSLKKAAGGVTLEQVLEILRQRDEAAKQLGVTLRPTVPTPRLLPPVTTEATLDMRERVKPYLLAKDGATHYSNSDGPFVDAIVDFWGRPGTCTICLTGLLPDLWQSGLAMEHHPRVVLDGVDSAPRVFWLNLFLDEDRRERIYTYLCAPGCTVSLHRWHEADVLAMAEKTLAEIKSRPPGWSITDPPQRWDLEAPKNPLLEEPTP